MPLTIVAVLLLLMMQLQDMKKMALVLLTAPLGMIGVSLMLATFRIPFGFVAMLGVIALAGMIIRNSVILVVQIDHDVQAGAPLWDAIVESAVRRLRPIVLTALAAILAMIPLTALGVLGPDGLVDHGRAVRRDAADAALPARAVRQLVRRAEAAAA